MYSNKIYDVVIVGTSPISILKYLKIREKYDEIVIVDKDINNGGLWKNINDNKLMKIEIACHLIEWYDKVYETLEKTFGIKFDEKIEPIRLSKSGKKEKYYSKKILLKTFAKKIIALIVTVLVKILNKIFNLKLNLFNTKERSVLNEFIELKIMFLYRVLKLNKNQSIRYPEGGFENFGYQISQTIKREKINIINDEILFFKNEKNLSLITKNNKEIICKKLIVTESFSVFHKMDISYLHQIFEVRKDLKFNEISHYIHFHDDTDVHRMTKMPNKESYVFMIQLRKKMSEFQLLGIIVSKFKMLGINLKSEDVILSNLIISKGYQSKNIENIENIELLYSIGDLSKNILKNNLQL